MQANLRLASLLSVALLLGACAPATTPATAPTEVIPPVAPAATVRPAAPTATPEVGVRGAQVPPAPAGPSDARVQINALGRDLRQLGRQLPAVDPRVRPQVMAQMADLLAAAAQLVDQARPGVAQLPLEQQQAIAGQVQRLQMRTQTMQHVMGGPMMPAPSPVATPSTALGYLDDMHRQMLQMHEQMRRADQEEGSPQLQAMMQEIGALATGLADLVDSLEPAVSRLSPDQQRLVAETAERMRDTANAMLPSTQPVTPSPPSPELMPTPGP